jgi:ferric-dicitrate binding protein FerR (iron transport regulator)
MVLNSRTRTAVWYNDQFRAALVLRGEATFKVPYDPSRDFLLDAGDRHFASKGGTFNVRLSGGAIELTVLNGEVSVSAPPVTEQRAGNVELAPPTLLKAGETIGIQAGKQSARSLSRLEAQTRIAWQRG